MLSCRDFALDESSMTGESDTVKKGSLAQSLVQRDELKEQFLNENPSMNSHHAVKSPIVLSGQ